MSVSITSATLQNGKIRAEGTAPGEPTWTLNCYNGTTLLPDHPGPTGHDTFSGGYYAEWTGSDVPAATSYRVVAGYQDRQPVNAPVSMLPPPQ